MSILKLQLDLPFLWNPFYLVSPFSAPKQLNFFSRNSSLKLPFGNELSTAARWIGASLQTFAVNSNTDGALQGYGFISFKTSNCFSFSVISSHFLGCIVLAIEVDDADFVIDAVAADVKDVIETNIVAVVVVNIIDNVIVFCTVVVCVKLTDEQLNHQVRI